MGNDSDMPGANLMSFDDDILLDGAPIDAAADLAEQRDRDGLPAWWQHVAPSSKRAQHEQRATAAQQLPSLRHDNSVFPWPLVSSPEQLLLPPLRSLMLTSRHSMPMPDCTGAVLDIDCMDVCSEVGIGGLSRTMSMPEAGSSLRELASAVVDPNMEPVLSAQLHAMDMQLHGGDMDALLLDGEPAQDSSSMPLLGTSRHGSSEYESARLSAALANTEAAQQPMHDSAQPPEAELAGEQEVNDAGEVARFLCVAEDDEAAAAKDSPAAGLPSLSSGGGSVESLISDGSVVYVHSLQSLQPRIDASTKSTPQVNATSSNSNTLCTHLSVSIAW